jgi:Spy/CpxP family protein refolding chaperone
MKSKIIFFLLILIVLCLASFSFSQPFGMRYPPAKERREERCWRASELNLTSEQKKGLSQIQQSYFRETQLLRAQLFSKQVELREFLTDKSANAEAVRSKHSEVHRLQSRFEEKAIEYLIHVRNILTEEQLKNWCPEQEFPFFRRMGPMHPRRGFPPPERFKEE